MLQTVLVLFIYLDKCVVQTTDADLSGSDGDFGTELVSGLREDANLDLSVDEEYEDLRAELLAYHTALASLASSRRSLLTTPCWNLGGICVDRNLCNGFRSLTEVPGCKDKLKVCCFAWNRFNIRDMREHGIRTIALPWSLQQEFGGKGISVIDKANKNKSEKKAAKDLKKAQRSEVLALILKVK